MRCISFLLLTMLAAAPAAAQETVANPRYVFTPVDEGALRLNTETGEVSLCAGMPGSRSCTLVPDEARAAATATPASEDRIAQLEARIAALEKQIKEGSGPASDEEALDRVMTLTDRMMRQFFGLVREMRREFEGETL
jgi:hypothetical protein